MIRKYRSRIYSNYVESWDEKNVPQSVDEFQNRWPTMSYVISTFFPIDKSAAILDLGCGHGTLVHYAMQAGYSNVKGVDVSKQQVELACKLGINNVLQGDLMETLKSIPPASLDAVITFDVIEHFTKDELIDLVDAIHAVLKSDSCWIIHTPNAQSPFYGTILYGDFTHEQAFTPSSIQQLLKASGFRKFIFSESGPRVHGIKSAVRFIIWKCIKLIYKLILVVESGDLHDGEIVSRNFYAVAYK